MKLLSPKHLVCRIIGKNEVVAKCQYYVVAGFKGCSFFNVNFEIC